MKDTAPISQGIIAVAALFGIIAAGVAHVLFDFSFIESLFIGVVVGAIAAVVLMFGWRDAAPGPRGVATPQAAAEPAPVAALKSAPVAEAAPAAKVTSKPVAASKPKPNVKAPAAKRAAADGKPSFLNAAREEGPDDLKQIKGVGPKLEKILHGMGIYHFDQVSTWGPAEQAWMDDNLLGFKGRATRDDWVAQAKTLAAGGTTKFSGKVRKGGVY
jgi:NADH-quinone oxidoreductase subunit E